MFSYPTLSVKNNLFLKYLQIFKLHELVTNQNNQTQLLPDIYRICTAKFWLAQIKSQFMEQLQAMNTYTQEPTKIKTYLHKTQQISVW